ncbi:MAG: UDP-N-acetylglucosamine 4,6-dehydratase family protein, partial [Giesbergeria sp.]
LLNRNVRDKVVLVTGAGGSIGSELCRQILKCVPACLVLVEMNEFSLYQIHSELEELLASPLGAELGKPELVALLGSAQNEARISSIMASWRPHTVYHAAAYKHVPLVEHNPVEGIRNNVWGTLACARAAAQHGVQSFVLISTDKAVRPTNIMGASKRLAELVVQALAALQPQSDGEPPATCFSIVRFGNVLGSSGSVVPLFRRQIAAGGPITLTHPEVTRYFMTIPEAAELVVQAGAMARGGEVFVLDMGESVRIYDLASRMVELAGMRVCSADCPGGEIEIKVTGLRPGEKLYEELLIGHNPQPTSHPRVMMASEQMLPWPQLEHELATLEAAMAANDMATVRSMLQRLAGYAPLSLAPNAPEAAAAWRTEGLQVNWGEVSIASK